MSTSKKVIHTGTLSCRVRHSTPDTLQPVAYNEHSEACRLVDSQACRVIKVDGQYALIRL
jgi:hypothetical protein